MSNYRKITIFITFFTVLSLFFLGQTGAQTSQADAAGLRSPKPAAAEQDEQSPLSESGAGQTVISSTTGMASSKERLPYIGEITGNQVNVRSGPAAIYYEVTQFNKGMLVVVREEKTGWACIDPAGGCFSWISKQYVKLISKVDLVKDTHSRIEVGDETGNIEVTETPAAMETPAVTETPAAAEQPNEDNTAAQLKDDTSAVTPVATSAEKPLVEPESSDLTLWVGKHTLLGEVTGDNVRVRAGSIRVPPANASEVQTKLNKGANVIVIGQRDDYYKIICPEGAYFWISLDYVKRVGPVTPEALAQLRGQVKPTPTQPLTPIERERKAYQDLAEQFKTERSKPLTQQDFTETRQNLQKLLKEAKSPSVQAAAQALERQLAQCEMGLEIWKTAQRQDKQLQATLLKIDNEIELLMAVHEPPEKSPEEIVVQGKLAKSAVFTAPYKDQRYLVLDDNERIIYYAVSDKEGLDLGQWVDKDVSMMVGQVEYDAFGKVRILKVSNIVELPVKQ